MKRSGLVSYGGDSEISDSEDERISLSSSPSYQTTAPVIAANTLGIPVTKPRQPTSPPAFVRPEVHPAPLPGLVDYEDDDTAKLEQYTANEEVFTTGGETLFKAKNDDVYVSEDDKESDHVERLCEESSTPCLFLPLPGVCLPPEPQGRCSNSLQDKILSLLKKKSMGVDFNESIQSRKDFRNPSIYEKLVTFCKLDEFGSNYPSHLYDPHEWNGDSYKNLRKAQMKAYEKKERAKLERTKVEFVTGTKRPTPLFTSVAPDLVKKPRRSKWDVGGSSGAESGGSRGGSPSKERPPLLGAAPHGMQPLPLVGAQAKAQATQLTKELSRLKGK